MSNTKTLDPTLHTYREDVGKIIKKANRGVKMKEVKDMHFYSKDKMMYPSVTTILDSMAYNKELMQWANYLGLQRKQYLTELKQTATAGRYMHCMCQQLVDPTYDEKIPVVDPLMDYYVRRRIFHLRAKLKECQWETIFTEKSFVSHTYEFGGTIDWFVLLNGKRTIADFKSAKAMRNKFLLQLVAYAMMMEDNGIEYDQVANFLCTETECKVYVYPRAVCAQLKDTFIQIYGYYKVKESIDPIMKEYEERL